MLLPAVTTVARAQRVYASPRVPEFRACEVCEHASSCRTLCLLAGDRGVPLVDARSRDGICGPNAAHMRNSWDLRP